MFGEIDLLVKNVLSFCSSEKDALSSFRNVILLDTDYMGLGRKASCPFPVGFPTGVNLGGRSAHLVL